MEIFPAIDLRDGKAVRLFQGDYDQMTVYSRNPAEVAKGFCKLGAQNLHMVDLDGAKDGELVNLEIIKAVVRSCGMFVQVGGGIRDRSRILKYLELGVDRIILGTAAALDFGFASEMASEFKERVAVGVDVKDGFVAINGWRELTDISGMDFCERLAKASIKTVIYTDISKDGGLGGTNMESYRELSKIKEFSVVASGGISFETEILELAELGIYGAILGKAIYTGKLDLTRAIELGKASFRKEQGFRQSNLTGTVEVGKGTEQ